MRLGIGDLSGIESCLVGVMSSRTDVPQRRVGIALFTNTNTPRLTVLTVFFVVSNSYLLYSVLLQSPGSRILFYAIGYVSESFVGVYGLGEGDAR